MGKEKKERKEKKEKKEKKAKKEKKEKREKRERGEDAAPASGSAKVARTVAPPRAGSRGYASVGDVDLAKRSPPFAREFYSPASSVSSLSAADVAARRETLGITLEAAPAGLSPHALAPLAAFAEAGFPREVLAATANFKTPSPIQAQSWPIVLSGHDMVGIAATGSGKTMAFGLPALTQILANGGAGDVEPGRPKCLVLAPTRELAQQTARVFDEAGKLCGVRCVCVYGGAPKYEQKKLMREGGGCAVIVATPGRLRDFMNDGDVKLDRVTTLVLDEADRMLDLGFEPEIREIAGNTRADRQTVMFSATWPQAIQGLASEFMRDPVKARVGSEGLKASHSVTQIVEVVEPNDKDQHLGRVLKKYLGSSQAAETPRTLIFALYKKECARLHENLRRQNWRAACIHGDMSQRDREQSVEQFKSGQCPLLIATDVAARGLDIKGVEYVINYTFPLTTEDYVHRIGRTGRAGRTGLAHTFFTQHDKGRAGELANVLREAGAEVPQALTNFGTHVKKKESKLYGAHFKEIDTSVKATKIVFD